MDFYYHLGYGSRKNERVRMQAKSGRRRKRERGGERESERETKREREKIQKEREREPKMSSEERTILLSTASPEHHLHLPDVLMIKSEKRQEARG